MRVVAGDGSGDHLLVGGVAPVAAAWRPGTANVLALARADGAVEVWAPDTVTRVRRLRAAGRPVALAWAGRRLVVIHRGGVTVYDRRGHVVLERAIPGVETGALSPSGRRVAVVAGGALSLVGGRTRGPPAVYTAPDRLSSVTWSPDGRLLLAARPRADQWVFLPVSGPARVVANAGIARQFDPARGRPARVPGRRGLGAVKPALTGACAASRRRRARPCAAAPCPRATSGSRRARRPPGRGRGAGARRAWARDCSGARAALGVGRRLAPPGSSRAASTSRADSRVRRASPYFAHSGEALAAASTSSAGAMRDRGATMRVCTTGVGTPRSSRIVTAASPMPSAGSSSSRS